MAKHEIWLALGLSTQSQSLVIAGLHQTQAEARRRAEEEKTNAELPFEHPASILFDNKIGERLSAWLQSLGLTQVEIIPLVRQFGEAVRELLDDVAQNKGWKR